MAKEIQTGVALTLKDNFSSAIKKAGSASADFASKTLGAIDKVDKVFSGVATKLGALGVTFSVGAATKDIIEMDARLNDLGVNAGMSVEEVIKLKQELYEVANAPDIKLDTSGLVGAMESVIAKTGDIEFATQNIRAMALAIRATGSEASEIGGLYAEFQKYGVAAEEAINVIDTLTLQGSEGSIELKDLATLGPRTISAYAASGRSGAKAMMEMGAALQVIMQGTGTPEQAATAFEAVMRELADPQKIKMLEQFGVSVDWTKKSLLDLMKEITIATGGSNVELNRIFGGEATRAFNYIGGQYLKTGQFEIIEKFNSLVGDGSIIQQRASEKAQTLAANLQNLQTAFSRFVNSGVSGPLQGVTDALNKLAENPENIQRAFKAVAIGIGSIAAIKGIAGISRLIGSISRLSGGKLSVTQSLEAATAMPVYVTNWGGMSGGGLPIGAAPGAGANPALFNPAALKNGSWRGSAVSAVRNLKPGQLAAGGAAAGIGAAFIAIPEMMQELDAIKANTELSDSERGKAKGGAIGDATGTIVGGIAGGVGGVAAGAAVGAAVGSVVPILGTAVGALVGAGVGALGMWLGGKAGRAIGEGIGEGVTSKPTIPASRLPPSLANYAPYTMNQQAVNLNGQVGLGVNISVQDDRVKTSSYFNRASAPAWLNTGYAYSARSYN